MTDEIANLMMVGYGLVLGFGVFGFMMGGTYFQAGLSAGSVITVVTMHIFVYLRIER
jgi:hypothetical protein